MSEREQSMAMIVESDRFSHRFVLVESASPDLEVKFVRRFPVEEPNHRWLIYLAKTKTNGFVAKSFFDPFRCVFEPFLFPQLAFSFEFNESVKETHCHSKNEMSSPTSIILEESSSKKKTKKDEEKSDERLSISFESFENQSYFEE